MRSTPIALAFAFALALVLGAGPAVPAGSAWTRISGPKGAGQQLGLARTADGTLHVIWNRGNPAPTAIFDTRFSPSGAKLGTTTVATDWGGADGLALLVMPDRTLRLFATGAPKTGSAVSGVNTLTASANGTGWALDQGAVWGGPGAGSSATIGATLTKDGQPVTGWRGVFQVGLAAGGVGTTVCSCFTLQGDLATDSGSGAVVMAGLTIGNPPGTYVERALPAAAGRVVLPTGTQDVGVSGISGRLGAPGVYVAYSDNTHAGVTKPAVRLYRYGGATRKISRGPFTIAKPFAGPGGRLWLVWGDAADGIFVTRTSKAVGSTEPVQKLHSPPGAGFLWNAQGEGSQGALDLFVDADAGGRGFWHTRVLAELTLKAQATKPRVNLSVRDAGDPVGGVAILVGGHRVKTGANGLATVTLGPGPYSATASAPGYKAVTSRFTVR